MIDPIPAAANRTLSKVNVPLLIWTAGLIVFGTMMVGSATGDAGMVRRQLVGVAVGIVAMGVLWAIDYKVLKQWLGPLSALLAVLLASVLLPGLGATVNGARSWLGIGSLRLFQPSEPGKLVFIVILAAVISEYAGRINDARDVRRILFYLGVPLGLIMLEPDLGTGLVFIAIASALLLVGGLRARWFAIFALTAIVLVGGVLAIDSNPNAVVNAKDPSKNDYRIIKKYQRDRLMVFLDSGVAPKGAGYNLNQSKIAIGSGGITGKGLTSGTQSSLHFIPERHTDFIFAVLGEELGFLGAVVLLGLYLALLITALEIAASSRDLFGALIATGVIGMWTFMILVNVGMTVGIMPITGIPLPFMSFGSSFMVTNLAGIGMLQAVWSRRYGT